MQTVQNDFISSRKNIIKDRKVQLLAMMEHYEAKVACLSDLNKPMQLLMLACWDAPFTRPEPEEGSWAHRRFVKQCKEYFEEKLREIRREARKYL